MKPTSNPVFTLFSANGVAHFPVIAGPCLVENEDVVRTIAKELLRIEKILPVRFIFKGSYRKANRTSSASFTGIGDEAALRLLGMVRSEYGLPTLTDVHEPAEAELAAEYCDVLQIPAFLARQTSLLVAAAKTGRCINIKKGQFMSPEDMIFAREKVIDAGNSSVLLTERGTFFGYGDLVVDFRSLVTMRSTGSPIIYDSTHSVQRPSQNGVSGGDRRFIAPLARAAMAIGIDGLFVETHPDPACAMSDKDSQLPLGDLEEFLAQLLRIRQAIA